MEPFEEIAFRKLLFDYISWPGETTRQKITDYVNELIAAARIHRTDQADDGLEPPADHWHRN
jgi:hypothetical protein